MGNFEPFMVKLDVVVQENIKVNVTWSLVDDLLAAQIILDRLEHIQESKWLKSCLNLEDMSAFHLQGL